LRPEGNYFGNRRVSYGRCVVGLPCCSPVSFMDGRNSIKACSASGTLKPLDFSFHFAN
jgi:hypothetical protein